MADTTSAPKDQAPAEVACDVRAFLDQERLAFVGDVLIRKRDVGQK